MSVPYLPMKPVLVAEPFCDPGWVFERKLDGERCGARREGGRVTLLSRTGHEMGPAYPELEQALSMAGPDLLVDGEIVAFKGGQTSFERLQRRLQIRDPARARQSRWPSTTTSSTCSNSTARTSGRCRCPSAGRA